MDPQLYKPWYLVTNSGAVIGRLVYNATSDGWIFFPHTAARQPGRKFHKDMNSAIPKWAFDLSDDLLTTAELKEWKAKHAIKT